MCYCNSKVRVVTDLRPSVVKYFSSVDDRCKDVRDRHKYLARIPEPKVLIRRSYEGATCRRGNANVLAAVSLSVKINPYTYVIIIVALDGICAP